MLEDMLRTLGPAARTDLRDVLIRDQADRDASASKLMRYRDRNGQGWADVIDLLTMSRRHGGRWCGCSGRSMRNDGHQWNGVARGYSLHA
jgi:hypothetical protein